MQLDQKDTFIAVRVDLRIMVTREEHLTLQNPGNVTSPPNAD